MEHPRGDVVERGADETYVAVHVADVAAAVVAVEIAREAIPALHEARVESHQPAPGLQSLPGSRQRARCARVIQVVEQAEGHDDVERVARSEIGFGDTAHHEAGTRAVPPPRGSDVGLADVYSRVRDIAGMAQELGGATPELEQIRAGRGS